MWRRSLVFISLAAWLMKLWVMPVLAQDAGTITVTGSVPPAASSITTALNLQNSANSVNQDQVLTYVVSYSSSNTAGVPLKLQVEWEKGHIEGATEPSVEALEYVVGSAEEAYGGALPVVDTLNKTITWDISNLPAGVGTQTTTFKLKTTAAYTGTLPVNLRTRLKVLSPLGIADKTQEVSYRFQRSSATAPATPQASPTSTIPTLETVAVRSVGKETSRIFVDLNTAGSLSLRYGLTPRALTNQVDSSLEVTAHTFTLENLAPETTYYFQVFSPDFPTLVSDIFLLTTAGISTDENIPHPIGMSISHQRSLLFSGATINEIGPNTKPLPVAENGVLDLSLALSNTKDVVSVDVKVRSENVLGVTTHPGDEFQSDSTRMTKISSSVFVGKLKLPSTPGRYILVAYVEDIYGNLGESELGKVVVVKPFTIRDQKSGSPIQDAKVELFVFNQQTRLFEVISNVSTAIDNPSYSDEKGIIPTNFPPARYLAIINVPGYKEAKVEFEVGEGQIYDFPQVGLEVTSNLLARQYHFTSSFFSKEWRQWMEQFQRLAKLDVLYRPLLLVQILLLVFLVALNCYSQKVLAYLRNKKTGQYKQIGRLVVLHMIRFWFEFYLFVNLVFSYYFWQERTFVMAFLFTCLAIWNIGLWLRFIWLRYYTDRALHQSNG